MRKSSQVSPEIVERAVRIVIEAKEQHPSQWAAIESIAGRIGSSTEKLQRWVRQAERRQLEHRLPSIETVRPGSLLDHLFHLGLPARRG